jgi:hypothetical protein
MVSKNEYAKLIVAANSTYSEMMWVIPLVLRRLSFIYYATDDLLLHGRWPLVLCSEDSLEGKSESLYQKGPADVCDLVLKHGVRRFGTLEE